MPGGFPSALEDFDRLVDRRIETALSNGAMQPIATDVEIVEDGGIRFLVHVLGRLEKKKVTTTEQKGEGINPFLPPDPELTVVGISPTHLCVLNKFNVIDRHLLIITREFEDQAEFLTLDDFEALTWCMQSYGGLGFYNAGIVAGASQPHKHLQLVATPLGNEALPTPVDAVISQLDRSAIECPQLGFSHRLSILGGDVLRPADGDRLHQQYLELLRASEIVSETQPYNLLLTSGWMMVVPRSEEFYAGISVNALGFAGSLLVRNRQDLELIRGVGPLAVLRSVSAPERKRT
jgi:ATP adenylyltransferase